MVKVTIGISIYNAEKFLHKCISSVLSQTFEDFELLLVNDGSQDKSLTIAHSFNDPRIKIIDDGINRGLISRLNQMVDLSKAEYFVRMDADDIMFPKRIEEQYEVLSKHPDIDLVHTSAISIDKDNNVIGQKICGDVTSKKDVLSGIIPIHPSVMAKTAFFKKFRYHEGFIQMEDLELWFRSISSSKFVSISNPLLFYREDSSSNSSKHLRMLKGKIKFASTYKLTSLHKFKLILQTLVKGIVLRIFENFKMEGMLLNRRYSKLSVDAMYKYQKLLNNI